jgi:proline iminopeptidase
MTRDGIAFRYVREGRGRPLVVIGSSRFYPRAFSADLRRHFDMVFVDARHFIPSYRPAREELAGLTPETLADDVEALRVHLGVDRWAVLGHSVHVQIALAYARKYPDRTSHLVMVAGEPYGGAEPVEMARKLWDEQASDERKERHAANRRAIEDALAAAPEGRRAIVDYIGNAAVFWADPTYDCTPLWEGMETGPAFEHLFAGLPSREEIRSALEAIRVPMLLVLGRLDFCIAHTAWEKIIGELPSLTYVLIEDGSHNPQTENHERFDRELVEWFARN